ncbi:MAG: hypothetical protein ACFE0J_17995 [Elainellaceae cyanobacterium]
MTIKLCATWLAPMLGVSGASSLLLFTPGAIATECDTTATTSQHHHL